MGIGDYDDDAGESTALLGRSTPKTDYTATISQPKQWRKKLDSVSNQLDSITYTWKNINVRFGEESRKRRFFQRDKHQQSRHIVNNVSGEARPGELTAILGSSAAGKTSLLNALTFQNSKGLRIDGERLINGVPVGPEVLSLLSAYIQQDDIFLGTLTVREHLIFHALLKLPKQFSYEERLERVEEIMQELGLTKCADTLIGITGRLSGISGGEKKRLAFASEVLEDPLLLFADEPTSGLDSYTAQTVVQVLKVLSRKGKSILVTIHQPSSEIFELFDRIILMAEGRTAFAGSSADAITFFSEQGLHCPLNYNPANFFVDVLAVQPRQEAESRLRIEQMCDLFEKASSYDTNGEKSLTGTQCHEMEEFIQMKSAINNQSKYKASWLSQFRAVFWRSCLTLKKEPMIVKMRLLQTLAVSLVFGLFYKGQQLDQDGVMNLKGVLFIFLTTVSFKNVFAVVQVFSAELPIFFREHFSGMYRTDVYMLSKTLADLPVQIIYPMLFNSISYFLIGLNPELTRFLNSLLIIVLVSNVTCSYGFFISCISSSLQLSLTLAPTVMLPLCIFGGYFLNKRTIPPFLDWLKYLSWFLFGYEALNINQWDGINVIQCNGNNSTCLENGKAVLDSLHFEPRNFQMDLIALVVQLIGFRLLALFVLLLKTIRTK